MDEIPIVNNIPSAARVPGGVVMKGPKTSVRRAAL